MNVKTAKRLSAYIIDLLLLGLILMIINFFAQDSEKITSLNFELSNLNERYLNNNISINDYISNYGNIIYKLDYERASQLGINILIIIIYFIIIPTINKGKTFGLYVMGYKITREDRNVSLNSLIIRNLIANGLLYLLVSLAAVYILEGLSYFICITIFGFIQILLVIISCFMITYRKDKKGLQDILSNTKIVNEKR